MDFQKEVNRIYAMGDGKVLAEITFPVKDGVATIDHTFVDDSLRGQGIAGFLVDMAVEEIRKNGWTVNATCSYAVSRLSKQGLL